MLKYDPQSSGPQYLENLATGYWFSEALFTAIELDIFSLLDPHGKNTVEIAKQLDCESKALERYLYALCSLGLLSQFDNIFFNTKISSEYLVKGKEYYQGDSILWRKYLTGHWQGLRKCIEAGGKIDLSSPQSNSNDLASRIRKYINAMDNVARIKVNEIVPIFKGLPLSGNILDIGAGSGAISAGFLKEFPDMEATLVDISQVLDYTKELMTSREFTENISYCETNILENWHLKKGQYDLVVLSNIVHAYSEKEIQHILKCSVKCLKADGFLLVHDFFLEHFPEKATLFDLNMLINTYNGKVFEGSWLRQQVRNCGLHASNLISLETDTAVIIASDNKENLENLCLDKTSGLIKEIEGLGFKEVYSVPIESIHVPDWTPVHCQFGCKSFGKLSCPPNSPSPEETRNVLKDYSLALLLEGEPPTNSFQKLVLQAEKKAFKTGYYKAFAYWAGPCTLCENCNTQGQCFRPEDTRPSMEGAGIDVFETVKRAEIALQTLNSKSDYCKYFALLLLE
ncbi:MAG: metal-binding protein [Desulfitibacter sp. BRH_c19]|nr:MAG: metal-binding protein [Desulfitibacter sp. BRH_c19]